ncbi:hypothetical protein L1987_64833 [Smallanthus sonchifolius]|uniref:Uncharacterized protein n=1 Tax=Smallanthus sonchifolius TaxID=185202 RepID=A0ACB9BST3_9ASTR|nr:hypothetical protein L1987_64833 [Smallanthus sonchifolius]
MLNLGIGLKVRAYGITTSYVHTICPSRYLICIKEEEVGTVSFSFVSHVSCDRDLSIRRSKISALALQAQKLTSTNYAAWSVMVKIVLGANGLTDAIDKEKGIGIEERKKFMALGVIFQTLPEDVMLKMPKYSELKDVWEALRVRYLGVERTQKARLQMLISELDGLIKYSFINDLLVDYVAFYSFTTLDVIKSSNLTFTFSLNFISKYFVVEIKF